MQPYPCHELRDLLSRGAQLVDVRSPTEFAAYALPGAQNLPVQQLIHAGRVLDPARPVLVYCQSGARSAAARQGLLMRGFGQVIDLGGIGPYRHCS